ncbi:NADP-dependent oxidoreductase [Lentilactobacillus sp. SPB1-3]|uniref:NADP-dependent oxidoreductase n=1 Tax=Lentilactobacillus terminaliae TaxID=3003483 RepID=A0ACD5DDD8_9LACO|nr:NADP-dependent oxidoreductase [Lentilactobacillus sp. SPB1-3]MCZ0977971.1 NADP-dependent oxidoreductase [Lentilactobacillus sp. SPB1-3]
MQAFGYDHNGGPDVFTEYDVPTPTLKDTDILIQTEVFGLNNFERSQRAGVFGETNKQIIPGRDVAGVVKSVGSEVSKFKPGDRVVAHGHHAYAEFATSSEANTVRLPENVSFEDAAAVVTAGITAYKTLHFFGNVQSGQTVIVKGASGGVGSVAAQLAEGLGAHVIGIGSSKNADYVKSLGVSEYVAYDQDSPAEVLKDKADVVINSAMNGAGGDEDVAMVKPNGVIASVAMDEPETTKPITFKHVSPTSEISDATALQDIVDLMADNKLSIKIGNVLPFSLSGVQKGHQILEEPHDGRVIISKNA